MSNNIYNSICERTKVLSFTANYLPGFKAGGPIRTVANMLTELADKIEFWLVTSDRDLGDIEPYPNIIKNRWLAANQHFVYYSKSEILWPIRLIQIILRFQGRIVHVGSFFSFRFSILPVIFCRFFCRDSVIVISPRGEFSEGALGLKPFKKLLYVCIAKTTFLYRNVLWAASSVHEQNDIYRIMGRNVNSSIVPDISCPPKEFNPLIRQHCARLRILFISRISPMKNLIGAIRIVAKLNLNLNFDVYGPIEDLNYWHKCCDEASALRENILFSYKGEVHPTEVSKIFESYDLLFLPTLGENFCHIIAEALGSGLPVLTSDATPWRNLEAEGLGWDIPLGEEDMFIRAIEKCSCLSSEDYLRWRLKIRSWSLDNLSGIESIKINSQFFCGLISK